MKSGWIERQLPLDSYAIRNEFAPAADGFGHQPVVRPGPRMLPSTAYFRKRGPLRRARRNG